MIVTNGTVEYKRNVKLADFENKVFGVTLSFGIAEGEDAAAVTAKVGDMAVAEVHRRLGLAPQPDIKADIIEVPTPARRTRAKVEPSSPPQETTATQPATSSIPPGVTEDPAAMSEPQPIVEVVVEEPVEPPKPLSDKDMTEVVTRARAKGVPALKIRETIQAKNPDGTFVYAPRMGEIPQDRRAAFVKAIEALPADEKAGD